MCFCVFVCFVEENVLHFDLLLGWSYKQASSPTALSVRLVMFPVYVYLSCLSKHMLVLRDVPQVVK